MSEEQPSSDEAKIKIEVLGMGCPKCKMLELLVKKTLKELSIESDVEKVTEIEKITNYGVLCTPALVINGEVKYTGIPKEEELKKLLKEYKN